MEEIEILKAMRDDFLKKADALDFLIKKIETMHDGKQYVKEKRKRRIGNTSFNVESFTKHSEIDDGGVFMTEDEFDGVL